MPSKTRDADGTQDRAVEAPDNDGSVFSWAKHYDERGFAPTPITKGEKGARLKDWDERRLGAAEIETTFRLDDNVGLVLGRLSGNLVLIDLDSASAVRLGGRFLPETGMVSGRPAKPDSHRFYRCDPLPPYRSFKSPKTGNAIVEILADGRQAAVAPSRLSDGEQKTWSRFHEPADADADDLLDRVTRLAVTCELEAVWPEGGRHNAALALAGGLLRAGWESGDVEGLIEYLCRTTTQPGEIRNIVRDTQAKLDADEPVTGWPSLAKATGEKASIDGVLDWLGISGVDLDDDRPAIKVTSGDLDKLSSQAWEALASVNDPPSLFRRSNRPARVERIDDTDTVIVRELDDTLLRHHVADAIRWYQIVKGVSVPSKPPIDVIKNMGAYADIPLPVLNRVVTAPVFSPEGVLQTEPGYHPEARVYYQPPAGLTVPTVPETPTPEDVAEARSLLVDDLLHDFPFVDEADRAHAIALAILPFVRDMIDGPTPMHLFEASKPGTGKGLLVRVLTAIFAGGTGADETTLPTVEEEVRKKLFSLLMEGVPYIYFDNISERVDSGTLASTLTSQTFRDRKLGVSETYYVPVRCCWIGSGNNPVMSNEITRRTVRCRLVAGIEHPHLRTEFKHPELFAYLRQNRGRFVGAVLTLVQAWIAEGKPAGQKSLGTYEAWAQVIGGILSVAGVSGFLDNIEAFYAEADDEGAAWRSFVGAWWERLGPERQTATDLLTLATDAGLPFVQWQYEKQKAELGTMLRKQADNVYSGFAIKKAKAPRGANSAYRLEPKEGQTWVPPTPDDRSAGSSNGLFPNDSRVLLRASERVAPRAGEA